MSAEEVIFTSSTLTLDITIFNNSFSDEQDYECQILFCGVLFAFKHKNNLLP